MFLILVAFKLFDVTGVGSIVVSIAVFQIVWCWQESVPYY